MGSAGAPGAARASDGCGPGTKVVSGNVDGDGLAVASGDGLGGVGLGAAEVATAGTGLGDDPALTGDAGARVNGAVIWPFDPHAVKMVAAHTTKTSPLSLRFMVCPLTGYPARTPRAAVERTTISALV